jgi:hypothetical protein
MDASTRIRRTMEPPPARRRGRGWGYFPSGGRMLA